MANVFGAKPADKKAVSSSMRLNPLYDQDGTVEVSSNQAQVAKSSDTASQDSGIGNMTSVKSKKGTYKRPKKTVDEEEDELPVGDAQGTKINYSKNFRFGRPAENGVQNGPGVKKLTTFGVVMPSRVKQVSKQLFSQRPLCENVKIIQEDLASRQNTESFFY